MYKVRVGKYKGLIGKMIARYSDASYDDITLQFDDGITKVFQFREVEEVVDVLKKACAGEGLV